MNAPGLRSRTLILAALFACAFTGLLGRLAYLQTFRHAELAAAAERQYSKTVTIRPKRGPILDRHGNTLAASSAATCGSASDSAPSSSLTAIRSA